MPNTVTVTTPSELEILITRRVDAPRRLVWKAMQEPALLRRWLLGPPGWDMTECENDLRVGGSFRQVWKHTNGDEMAMHGEYREVTPPERIVRTKTFDLGCEPQSYGQVATLILAEQAGLTVVTITLLFQTKEARDGMLASGMEHGVQASYDRLEEVLQTNAA